MRSPARENGGFMSTTVGFSSRRDATASICSASSVVTLSATPLASSSAARRGASSLPITRATPARFAQAASMPVPALGSSTTSPGWRLAAQAAT